jgi:dimethylhistidine N-methyltransferase
MGIPLRVRAYEAESESSFARDVVAGLTSRPKWLSPKYFYDAAGARLFDAITLLPEYYPTRTEAAIVQAHEAQIAQAVHACLPEAFVMADLGAGTCAKAARLFDALRPSIYLAIDISADYMQECLATLQRQHPHIAMVGLGHDFSRQLAVPHELLPHPVLTFYPGSSIGNFDRDGALRLLRQARRLSEGGALMIGVDLVKDTAVLEAAYDDSLGVTAAFNLNLLRHVNHLAGCDFDTADWQHVAFFDGEQSRIEMHLQARRALSVRWPGGERRFDDGERIHTENSYKWTRAGFAALLREAGFEQVQSWTDPREWFAVLLAS